MHVPMRSVSDLVIVATKNHHLEAVIEEMRPIVGPATTILTLLNGIARRSPAEAFGWEKILHGFAIGLNSTHVGNRIEFTLKGESSSANGTIPRRGSLGCRSSLLLASMPSYRGTSA